MKFRKRPIEVEAEQYVGPICFPKGEHPTLPGGVELDVFDETFDGYPVIKTLEGKLIVRPNDWIITGIHGEKYPCNPDIFEQTYEPIDPQ